MELTNIMFIFAARILIEDIARTSRAYRSSAAWISHVKQFSILQIEISQSKTSPHD